MKFSSPQAATLILALLPATTLANSCKYDVTRIETPNWGNWDVWNEYSVWAENVQDISGICGGLWDNLKRFGVCAPSLTYCGGIEETHILNWRFRASSGCNGGHIESTWWEATRNRFGSIHCSEN